MKDEECSVIVSVKITSKSKKEPVKYRHRLEDSLVNNLDVDQVKRILMTAFSDHLDEALNVKRSLTLVKDTRNG